MLELTTCCAVSDMAATASAVEAAACDRWSDDDAKKSSADSSKRSIGLSPRAEECEGDEKWLRWLSFVAPNLTEAAAVDGNGGASHSLRFEGRQ